MNTTKKRDEVRLLGLELVGFALCLLPLLRGFARPYWISVPSVRGVAQWGALFIEALLLPVGISVTLLIIGDNYRRQRTLSRTLLLRAIVALCAVFALSVVYYSGRLYFLWSQAAIGRYFLWPYSTYYFQKIWEFARPYAFHAATGAIMGIAFYLLYKLTKGRVMEKGEALLGVLLGLIHGPERIVIVLLVAFFVTVIWFLFQKFRGHSPAALRVTPGLFIASYLVLLFIW